MGQFSHIFHIQILNVLQTHFQIFQPILFLLQQPVLQLRTPIYHFIDECRLLGLQILLRLVTLEFELFEFLLAVLFVESLVLLLDFVDEVFVELVEVEQLVLFNALFVLFSAE